jgi:hypothetical protein
LDVEVIDVQDGEGAAEFASALSGLDDAACLVRRALETAAAIVAVTPASVDAAADRVGEQPRVVPPGALRGRAAD